MLLFLLLGSLYVLPSTAISETQAMYRHDHYAALGPGQGGTGSTIAVHEEINVIMCALQ